MNRPTQNCYRLNTESIKNMNITHNSIPILFPLPNDTNRKVYKPLLHFFSMRKSNSTLAKTLGIGAIAAAATFMPMKANADATTLDYVNTVISEAGVDQDDTRDGKVGS